MRCVEVAFNCVVRRINERRKSNGNAELVSVIGEGEIQKIARADFPGQPEADAENDESVDQLRNCGRACGAKPEHFATGGVAKKPEHSNVHHLADSKSSDAAGNDPLRLAEYGIEGGILDWRDAGGRDTHRNEYDDEGIEDQAYGEDGESSYSGFAVVFVDEVGSDEDDGPGDHAEAHDISADFDQFAAENFTQNCICHEEAGKNQVYEIFSVI